MDLQPLYDVKERLEHAAVAGTGLLGEDFRLKRAAESLKPLAAASPVFARISQSLEALPAAPAQERGGMLLDTLALVDAVAYTQAGTGGKGELTPLRPGQGRYLPLSYGQLHPLLECLTGTGGGRMGQLRDAWEEHPEYFEDYRLQPALIAGLGESYAELAELNMRILKAQGPGVVPLLKEGFDPAGKKEMARRVEVISALEGAAATAWLREILPQAKKDVRSAVVVALGEDPENIALLLDLAKAERGGGRDAVLQALAKLDGETVQDFWTAEIKKQPEHVEFLKDSATVWASDLAASAFRAVLERPLGEEGQNIQLSESDLAALNRCRTAVLGKSSPAMLDCWRWIDSQLPALSKLKRGPNVTHVDLGTGLPSWLLDSLLAAGPGPLCGLCRELWEKDGRGSRYLAHAAAAAMLTRPAAEVYGEFAPFVERAAKERGPKAERVFDRLFWNQEKGTYQFFRGPEYMKIPMVSLAEPLDPRWFDLLTRLPGMEETLRRLVRPDDPEQRAKVGEYLFRLIREGGRFIQEDIEYLVRCGWTQWKGFLDKKVKKDGSMTAYAAVRLLNATSLTGPEKAAELRSLYKIVTAQSSATARPKWPAVAVEKQIADWEA